MSQINENGKRSWLVISYFANESGMACSNHIDDRMPLLKEKGIDVTLLSSSACRESKDVKHIRVPLSSPSGLRVEIRRVLKKIFNPRWLYRTAENFLLAPVYPFYFVEKFSIRIDATWYWTPIAAFAGLILCIMKRPHVIYSTGGPVSAHLAAWIITRLTGIKWIAEFQDPLIHSYCAKHKVEYKLVKLAERFICEGADRIVFLTGGARDATEARNHMGSRADVIYPGSAPPVSTGTCRVPLDAPRQLKIVHFGSLEGPRNMSAFLPALARVIAQLPELVGVIKLRLYGWLGKDVMRLIERFPYPGVIEVKGAVSRSEAIEEMQKSGVLLLVQGADPISSETIPSKAYEYFHVGHPIFGLVYRNGELREILSTLGHHMAEADDPEDIWRSLLTLIAKWEAGLLNGNKKPSPFTVENAVERLLAAVDEPRKE